MHLVDDWRHIALKAWSVRFAVLSAVLSAAEFAMPYVAPDRKDGGFAVAAFVVSMAAAVARIVAQPTLWRRDADEPKS